MFGYVAVFTLENVAVLFRVDVWLSFRSQDTLVLSKTMGSKRGSPNSTNGKEEVPEVPSAKKSTTEKDKVTVSVAADPFASEKLLNSEEHRSAWRC